MSRRPAPSVRRRPPTRLSLRSIVASLSSWLRRARRRLTLPSKSYADRALALAAMVIAVGMTVVTVVELIQSVRSDSVPIELLRYLVSDSGDASDPAAEDSIRVLYEVNLLKVPEHQTNGIAHISIGRRFLAFLYDTTNSRYVYDTHDPRFAPDTPPVLPEYSALTITLTIEQHTGELALIQIPLSCVSSCENANGYVRRQ